MLILNLIILTLLSTAAFAKPIAKEELDFSLRQNAVVIVIDSSKEGTRPTSQTLTMYQHSRRVLRTAVSTGFDNRTPVGKFDPRSFNSDFHFKGKGFSNRMSNAIAFDNYYLYGSSNKNNLGRQSTSLGFIKMSLEDSQNVFNTVWDNRLSTKILIYR